MAVLLAGSVGWQAFVVTPALSEAAATLRAERADERQRLHLLNEARRQQVINEASLLAKQEDTLRAMDEIRRAAVELRKTVKGD